MNPSPDDIRGAKVTLRVLVSLLLLSGFCVPASAQSVVGPKGVAYRERMGDDFIASDFFGSYSLWFVREPAWLVIAMPRSSAAYRVTWFDQSGDGVRSTQQSSDYIGTSQNLFDVRLFDNVGAFHGGSGGSKISKPLFADSVTAFTYTRTTSNTVGTADQWSAGTNWDAIPTSGATTQLVFGNGTSLTAGTTVFTNNDI